MLAVALRAFRAMQVAHGVKRGSRRGPKGGVRIDGSDAARLHSGGDGGVVDEQPSLVLLVLNTSTDSAGQLSCFHGLTWIAAVVRAERSDHDGRLLEVRRSMRGHLPTSADICVTGRTPLMTLAGACVGRTRVWTRVFPGAV